ncbi:MAG: hypothetical protein HYY14_02180 [Candidatus Omnitrophica bacterium]|nr:hypothetical protein [Candidatus Omnitrophota bacterium]
MMTASPSPAPVQLGQIVEKIYEYIRQADRSGEGVLWPAENDEEYRIDKELTIDNLIRAWRCILTVLEIGGHRFLFQEAKRDYDECRKSPLAHKMGFEEPYLIWVGKAREYLGYLHAIYAPVDSKTISHQQASLIPLLRRCENYVVSRKLFAWRPCDETDIHTRIEELLGCYYFDLQPKPRIPKPVKGFEPDTVLPSIKSLIEYKFVNSTSDCKRVLDEILADIGGYQSTSNRLCVFVIYETDRFIREEEWRSAIEASKPAYLVEIVLLKGVRFDSGDEQRSTQHRETIRQRFVTRQAAKSRKRKTVAKG